MKTLNFHPFLSLNRLFAWFGAFSGAKALGLVFMAGFLVRLVPELLAGAVPIGFDTVYYAAVMKSGVVWANWSSFFTSTWLLHAFTVPLYSVFQIDPFLLLKVVAPALYGLNVAGVYWVGKKMLGWDVKLCLAAAGLFAFQLAALRISWDLLRNTLGMGLLLFALPFVGKLGSKRDFAVFALLSLLTVFAHEYAGVALVTIVLGVCSWRFARKRFGRAEKLTVLAFVPALSVFLTGLFLRFFPVNYNVTTTSLSTGEASVGRFTFFANYLVTNDQVFQYAGYTDLLIDVVLLFAFLYLSYLLLVWKGFFRNGVLNIWTGLLLVGSFGCLVWPFFALDFWSRWMFMLVYPFTFFAVNGLHKLLSGFNGSKAKIAGISKKIVFGGLGATVLLGSVYLATPLLMNTVQVGVFTLPSVSAHFCSAPAVPYQDVEMVSQAIMWLEENSDDNSCVLVNRIFLYWDRLYSDNSHVTLQFWNDAGLALGDAVNRGFGSVYFVWWNRDIGWYNVSVPSQFVSLRDFGRISVYEFTGSVPV
ncbi:hypothetical protein JXA31_09225 [Candidatus Bathyarchaeota archaeon]|nr:hypothetical protein [Candidatus Bathyarchaeota archaeon]